MDKKYYELKPISEAPKEDGLYFIEVDGNKEVYQFKSGQWRMWSYVSNEYCDCTPIKSTHYLSPVPAVGAVWVKASDRLPEHGSYVSLKISTVRIGGTFWALNDEPEFHIGNGKSIYPDEFSFLEWLDESASPSVDHIGELEREVERYKSKADKWDALAAKIAKFYPEDESESEGDLCDIGEVAATAFGWL
ncbi:MAG: hypothetical protein J7527_01685 [Chitinophagaceae bacterium]|nr:hypothetical protein [Chitinophagaceae bacterium]